VSKLIEESGIIEEAKKGTGYLYMELLIDVYMLYTTSPHLKKRHM
jgi:hypothetical protein